MMQYFSTSSFIAGVVVGALLAGAWFFSSSPDLMLSALSTRAPGASELSPESNLLSVADQPPGGVVTIESVTVPPPGVWVAVREVVGGELGNVLGAARVGGPRTNISIPLLRSTEAGRPYAIELYRDDNNSAFAVGTNSVYIDFDTSAPVIARFSTTN